MHNASCGVHEKKHKMPLTWWIFRYRLRANDGNTRDEEPQAVGKIPRKLFKIGEVMAFSGLSRQTIHYYTVLGLITAVDRTPSRHRLYGEEVFELLERIQEMKKTHTLEEIRGLLGQEHEKVRSQESKGS